MFTGLSAFPLTPLRDGRPDEQAFVSLIKNLVSAGVNSIGALGSTGNYAYLTRETRRHVAQLAVEHAGNVPVMVSVGAVSLDEVLRLTEDAQQAGVSAVLLAPVSYQKLNPEEVFTLYQHVSKHLSVPLCVYDNPGTTGFNFDDELYARIASLPHVASIKIPGISADPGVAVERVAQLRKLLPEHISIGISGDTTAADGLNAGCDLWYSVIGGLYPQLALALTHAIAQGNHQLANDISGQLEPLWALFRKYGSSLRVMAAAAEISGMVSAPCLPLPLLALEGDDRQKLRKVLQDLHLAD